MRVLVMGEISSSRKLAAAETWTDHRQNCHQRHCKTNIAYSQALRLRQICSLDEDYLRRVDELTSHLVDRGHGKGNSH